MTAIEKFDQLANGGDLVLCVYREFWQGNIYPRSFLIHRNGEVSGMLTYSEQYVALSCFETRLNADWWKRRGRGYREYIPINSGETCRVKPRVYLRYWREDDSGFESYETAQDIPIRFVDKVVMDKFNGYFQIRERFKSGDFEDEWEVVVDQAFKLKGVPESMFGLVKRKKSPRSLQKLREEYVLKSADKKRPSWSNHKSSNLDEYKPCGDEDVVEMAKIMQKGRKKTFREKLAAVKKVVKRRIRRVKKVSKSEQAFFSMILGANKIADIKSTTI